MNYKRKKWIIGLSVIFATVIFMAFSSMSSNSVYFYVPEEVVSKAQALQHRQIKLGGMVKNGSIAWQPDSLQLEFVLTNLKGVEIKVSHKGAPPDMFKEDAGVVVDGKISADGRSFRAYQLLVKHSEEYKTPEEHHSIDKELLEKSIFKNSKS